MPTLAAGEPGNTAVTRTPPASLRPRAMAVRPSTSCKSSPSQSGATRPALMRSCMTRRALLMGMAKPMPSARASTAVLMPMSTPSMFSSGPPLLPGLMAASVCTRSVNAPSLLRIVRPSAETTPVVTVWLKPKGLPMAMTVSPGMMSPESPSLTAGSFDAPLIWSTAMSKSGSAPLTAAGNSLPSSRCTMTSSPPAITCALVSTRPFSPSTITPEPRLTRFCRTLRPPGISKPGKPGKPGPKNCSRGESRCPSTI